MAATLRDALVKRLVAEFGEPWQLGKNLRWSIERPDHAPMNISLNSWQNTAEFAAWVFNPSVEDTAGIWHMNIRSAQDIDGFVAKVRDELAR